MTCITCKTRKIEYLSYDDELYPPDKLAFCAVCRHNNFPRGIVHESQYVKYWVLKSKPYIEALNS